MVKTINKRTKFYNIIRQSYKAGKGQISYKIHDREKKGTDMLTPGTEVTMIASNHIDSIINLLSDYSRIGPRIDLQVQGIDYYIDKKCDVRKPDVESICYRFSNEQGLKSSTLLISTSSSNSSSIERLIKKEDKKLTNILKKIDTPDLDELLYDWMDESFIENFNKITKRPDEKYNPNESLEWEPYNKGHVRLSLHRNFICEKDFPNKSHNIQLSSILKKNNIEKPWEYKLDENCQKCGGRMISTPPFGVVKDFKFKNNEKNNKSIKAAIEQIINLGKQSISMINNIIKIDYKKDANTDNLFVLPEKAYYETKKNYFKIEFTKLTNYQYKRTLGRTFEENEKLCLFKFNIFKHRKTYK